MGSPGARDGRSEDPSDPPDDASPSPHEPDEPSSDPDRPSGNPGGLPERPPCPFCGGHETSLYSEFGAHASVATYWCRPCHSPFEFIRWGPRGG